jgi:hypothetical protein
MKKVLWEIPKEDAERVLYALDMAVVASAIPEEQKAYRRLKVELSVALKRIPTEVLE